MKRQIFKVLCIRHEFTDMNITTGRPIPVKNAILENYFLTLIYETKRSLASNISLCIDSHKIILVAVKIQGFASQNLRCPVTHTSSKEVKTALYPCF